LARTPTRHSPSRGKLSGGQCAHRRRKSSLLSADYSHRIGWISELGVGQSVQRSDWIVESERGSNPANLRARAFEEQRTLGGSPAAGSAFDVSADNQGGLPRRFERACRLSQEPGILHRGRTTDRLGQGHRSFVRDALQGWSYRLLGSPHQRDVLLFLRTSACPSAVKHFASTRPTL